MLDAGLASADAVSTHAARLKEIEAQRKEELDTARRMRDRIAGLEMKGADAADEIFKLGMEAELLEQEDPHHA